MKKGLSLACLLLAGAFFSLAAQTSQSASVYMPPVTGTGIDQGDNTFFFIMVYRELSAQDHITMGTYDSSDFSVIGTITPVETDESPSSIGYRFDLDLIINRTGQFLSEQRYRYGSLDNLDDLDFAIKLMVDNILAQIESTPRSLLVPPVEPVPQLVEPVQQPVEPDTQDVEPVPPPVEPVSQPVQPVTPEYEENWRDRWLFLGFSALWTPRIYDDGKNMSSNLANPGGGGYLELQFLDSVALETGLEFALDRIIVDGIEHEVIDFMLEVPVLLKIVLKPGANFLLEPYGGIRINFSLFGETKPPPLAWVVGYQHGVKTGPGVFFFDFRFSMDTGKSSLVKSTDVIYQRYNPSFSVGYKFGVLPKK